MSDRAARTTPDKATLLAFLRELGQSSQDEEIAHIDADKALLAFIDDPEITEAFEAIHKWYA